MDYFVVNSFASQKDIHSGNYAGVCWLGKRKLDDKMMQAIAAEINLPVTSFVSFKKGDFGENSNFNLRWFTPTMEISLNGHGMIAAAHTIFNCTDSKKRKLRFNTESGTIRAYRGKDSTIATELEECELFNLQEGAYSSLLQGLFSAKVRNTRIAEVKVSRDDNNRQLIIRMKDDYQVSELRAIKPDFHQMRHSHDGKDYTGVIVTCRGDDDCEFYSRNFTPWQGVDEVRASLKSHAILSALWSSLVDKQRLRGATCCHRGGVVHMDRDADTKYEDSVQIQGKARIVIKGKWSLPSDDVE